jgi:cell division septal protein FtsQ
MATRHRMAPLGSGPSMKRRTRDAAPSRRVFLLLVFGIAQAIFFTSPLFRLGLVEVTGNARLSDGVIQAEAALPSGAHLLGLPLEQAAERVRRLHWIKDAAVRRYVPGRALIRVQERVPVLAVARDEEPTRWFVVSDDGTVLAPAGRPGENMLPRVRVRASELVVGGKLDAALVSTVRKCREALPPAVASKLRDIRADESGQLDLYVDVAGHVVEVRLGGAERTRWKLQVLQALLERLQREGKPVAYIDLRYHDPAVGHLAAAGKSLPPP